MSVPNFRSPQRLADYANRTGSHFFSPGTMRFFRSVLHSAMRSEAGIYCVIVSNQYQSSTGELGPRVYRIVRVEPDEDSTEADYYDSREYSSYDDAVAALAELFA